MRRLVTQLPSPAMIVAVIALIAALGGTGYAASTLTHGKSPSASAAAKKKKKKKKKKRKGRRGPRGPRGFRGPVGPQGPKGATGAAGATGPTGPSGTGTIQQSGLVKATGTSGGNSVTLVTNGSLQVLGVCTKSGGGTVSAVIQLKNNGGSAASVQDNGHTSGIDVSSGGTESVSTTASSTPPTNSQTGPGAGDASFSALSPDGSHLIGQGMAVTGAAVGGGGDCAFSVTNVSS